MYKDEYKLGCELTTELSIKIKPRHLIESLDEIGAQGGTRTPTPYGTRSLV